MTIGLKVTPAGDLVLDSQKKVVTVSGTAKAVQEIAIILRSLKGTFHLNTNFGTDHVSIIEANRNELVAKSEILKALKSYENLKSVNNIACTFDENRQLQVTISGTLITGEPIYLEETL